MQDDPNATGLAHVVVHGSCATQHNEQMCCGAVLLLLLLLPPSEYVPPSHESGVGEMRAEGGKEHGCATKEDGCAETVEMHRRAYRVHLRQRSAHVSCIPHRYEAFFHSPHPHSLHRPPRIILPHTRWVHACSWTNVQGLMHVVKDANRTESACRYALRRWRVSGEEEADDAMNGGRVRPCADVHPLLLVLDYMNVTEQHEDGVAC